MCIKIGTCGYGYYDPGGGWKDKYVSKLQAYSDEFRTGEINKTFYKLPMEKTAEKWRQNASDHFDFIMKAWQALTHPTSSPTWRNKKDKLDEKQLENFGYLRPNSEVKEAWVKTRKIAKGIDASVCVIQTPGSFDCTEDNENNMRELISSIDRGGIDLGWEPRGDWKREEDLVSDICDDLNLIHIVDLLRREPISDHPTAYVRLHGLNENEYNYDYDYSEEELKELAERLEDLDSNHEKVYCMFNNYEMFENAERLRDLLQR